MRQISRRFCLQRLCTILRSATTEVKETLLRSHYQITFIIMSCSLSNHVYYQFMFIITSCSLSFHIHYHVKFIITSHSLSSHVHFRFTFSIKSHLSSYCVHYQGTFIINSFFWQIYKVFSRKFQFNV